MSIEVQVADGGRETPTRRVLAKFRDVVGLRRRRRTVPAAVLAGSELIHLGGGESIACPGIEALPLAPAARRAGIGSSTLALPPARIHVLREVVWCPASRVVMDERRRIVAESVTHDMVDQMVIDDAEARAMPIEVEGTVAVYRSPWRPYFHTLVDHLPRAALLTQPAVAHLGRLTLLHDGALTAMEAHLLPRLLNDRIQLLEVAPGRPVAAERMLLPGYVTRTWSGAIPTWYRRWIDKEASRVGDAPSERRWPRRILADRPNGPRRIVNRAEMDDVLERHHIEVVDPFSMDPLDQIRCFRDAELVVGVSGSGIVNTIFSRSARVVELLPGTELLPHLFSLTAAKGLGYSCVPAPPDDSGRDALERLRHDVVVDCDRLDEVLTAGR